MPDFDKTCFVIMPFGNLEEKDDKCLHFLAIYENIKKAVAESGIRLQCVRADEIHQSGNVNEDIIEYLYKSKMVIADISASNTNVTYELGIRHSLKHNTILIAQNGTKLPFDFDNERTIFYEEKLQLSDEIDRLSKYVAGNNNGSNHKDSPVLKLVSKNINMMEMSKSNFDYKTEITNKISSKHNQIYNKLSDNQFLLGIEISYENANVPLNNISNFNNKVRSILREFCDSSNNTIIGYYGAENYENGVSIERELSNNTYYLLDFNNYGIISFLTTLPKYESKYLGLDTISNSLMILFSLANLFFNKLGRQNKIFVRSFLDTPVATKIQDYYPNLNGISYSHLYDLVYQKSEPIEYCHLYQLNTDYTENHIINFISNFLRLCNYQENPQEIVKSFYERSLLI